jgi:hypothetical protein
VKNGNRKSDAGANKSLGKQLSIYSELYSRVPEDHVLKQIAKAVDFSFINDLQAGSYCANWGRPAKEPVIMMKLKFFLRARPLVCGH